MEGVMLMCHCKACGTYYDSRSRQCPCQRITKLERQRKALIEACKMVLDDPGLTASANDVIRDAIAIANGEASELEAYRIQQEGLGASAPFNLNG